MTKLMPILAAGIFAFSFGGVAFAADEKPQDQTGAQGGSGETRARVLGRHQEV